MLENLEHHPQYLEWLSYDGTYALKMDPGFELYLRPKCAHSQRRFLFKVLEKNELEFFKKKSFNNFICFDVGANIGYFSKWLLTLNNIREVHSFEPDPVNFEILSKNTEMFSNSFVNQVAISNKKGNINLFLNPISSGDNTILNTTSNESILVKSITLDEYVNNTNISKVDFLKIDIQGAEIKAIEGGEFSIKFFRPMMYMEYTPEDVNIDALFLYDYIMSMTSSLNFKIYCINDGVSKVLSSHELKTYRGNIIINPNF